MIKLTVKKGGAFNKSRVIKREILVQLVDKTHHQSCSNGNWGYTPSSCDVLETLFPEIVVRRHRGDPCTPGHWVLDSSKLTPTDCVLIRSLLQTASVTGRKTGWTNYRFADGSWLRDEANWMEVPTVWSALQSLAHGRPLTLIGLVRLWQNPRNELHFDPIEVAVAAQAEAYYGGFAYGNLRSDGLKVLETAPGDFLPGILANRWGPQKADVTNAKWESFQLV